MAAGRRAKSDAAGALRDRQRRRSGRRAPLQRAADPFARPPLRQLSKVEVARLTGLSVQTASAIMNRLQLDGLLRREAPQRGRVGQPTVPLSLDPEGAFSLGLKIGRRSCELVLIDFDGQRSPARSRDLRLSDAAARSRFSSRTLPTFLANAVAAQLRRVAGLGVAAPFQLWSWGAEIGAPPGAMDAWRTIDIEREIAAPVRLSGDALQRRDLRLRRGVLLWRSLATSRLPVFLPRIVRRRRPRHRRRVVSRPHRKRRRARLDAGDRRCGRRGEPPSQLIACASIYQLERRVEAAGLDPSSIWRTPAAWGDFGPHLDAWIEEARHALAYACVAAISVIDFAAIVIDGAMPTGVRDRLTARVAERVEATGPARPLRRHDHGRGDRRRRPRDRRRRAAADRQFCA